jgi:hypothetical protein
MYHTKKMETRQQLLQHMNKDAAAIRNKMELHQIIRHSMQQCLAACIQAQRDHFENLINCKPLS